MKFEKISRIAKVSVVSAAMVFGLASCSTDYVVGYVYVTTNHNSPGVIDEYSIDFQSGALSQIGTTSAGNNPVHLVASPSGQFVYVINQGDSTVQEFAVEGDGTLASQHTYPTGGSHPTAISIDPQGAFLYVTNTCVSGYVLNTPGSPTPYTCATNPGLVSIFPVNSDNSLGTVATMNVGNNPVGIVASYFNHYVYVLDQDPANPNIMGFSQNTSTGALSPVTNPLTKGLTFAAGVTPSAITEDLTARFVYVTDEASNQLIGYTVQGGSNSTAGSLVPMVNGPFSTGLFPVAITVDPTGKLLYVADYNSNTIQGYAIDSTTGTPSGSVGAFATGVGAGPNCVAIDPALGTNLYTSDGLDNTVTGEKLNPSTGGLTLVQNSPFPASGNPTCLTVVPNGAHASQVITP